MSLRTVTRPAAQVLESGQRLSRCLLWRLQRRFFAQQGPAAFSQGIVPHYITCNPFIAQAYARVVLGYLRDLQPSLCPDQPVHLVELGGGSGRFGYLFLKSLLRLLAHSPLRDLPIRYVLTDFTKRNVDFYAGHPGLRPFVEAGQLDFALFDAEQPAALTLHRSGQVLGPATLLNPLVVLANYVFDGIPQDAFHIQDGRLYESLVTLTSPQAEPDLDDPGMLARLQVAYQYRPVSPEYYDDPACNQLLRAYAQRPGASALLFPCAALGCLHSLAQLSGGRLLLLAGDKGHLGEAALLPHREPGLTRHGSISVMVNYHAIGEYVRQQGGQVLSTPHLHASLNVSAFLLGPNPHDHRETRHAYRESIATFGPDDFFHTKKALEGHFTELTLPQSLALLRLSGWDPRFLRGCMPALAHYLPATTEPWRQELRRALHAVWDAYYHIGEDWDLPFHLGMLLLAMDCAQEALGYFQHSLTLYGPDPGTLHHLALCHERIGESEAARACREQARKLVPTPAPASAASPPSPPPAASPHPQRIGHHFGQLRLRPLV